MTRLSSTGISTAVCVVILYTCFHLFISFEQGHANFYSEEAIKIATVVCSEEGDHGPREEMAALIKSVVISTIVYNISKPVEFHILLEHESDQEYFMAKLKELGRPYDHEKFTMLFYSAIESVPEKHRKKMIYDQRFRCAYARIFLPTFLMDVRKIIYLDTDIIITGNLEDVWDKFNEMKSGQIVGVAVDFDPKNPFNSHFYKDIPYVLPKGVNSGLQVMNLEKMREYEWEKKLLRIYDDYAIRQNITMNDQKLINILLSFAPGLLLQLPCHFNYWYMCCSTGMYCDEAEKDPRGIIVLHGASKKFKEKKIFNDIFTAYKNFSLMSSTSAAIVKEKLMLPIRDMYANTSSRKKSGQNHGKCDDPTV